MTHRRTVFALPLVIVLGLTAAACGDGGDTGPTFEVVPLECDARLDRFEDVADRWPDPATLEDLQGVNADTFSALEGLSEDCETDVFARYDEIKCGYLTTVTGSDPASDAFIVSQQSFCEDAAAPRPEADPDDPTATIEPDRGPATTE